MKKRYILLSLSLLLSLVNSSLKAQLANTLPRHSNCVASPEPVTIVQADSTTITLVGKGNMTNNWTETTDGFTVVRNSSGIYEYAKKQNGKLVPDGVKANDPLGRTLAEQGYISNILKSIKPDLNPLKSSILNQVNSQINNKSFPTSGNIRVLALLIDYPDLTNTYDTSDFDSLLYGVNYRNGDGSFKTFYETSSDSQLTITVDVYGWYRADSNYIYYGADSSYGRAADLVREAVDAAENDGVDFSLYDNDSDLSVDGILAVHAGPGAEQGSQTKYIWSHRWVLNGGTSGQVTYDGVTINDYMINPETRTSGLNSNLVGIGVFCHEFGHNLGLPDLYDTDDSNGDSEGIGEWGLMGSAGYLGNEHRPGNLSAWSKEELGWVTPTVLTIGNTGEYSLEAASENIDEIYRINTGLANEYFLLENRQKLGLDSDLKGEGLAVWHINTDKTTAPGNGVNADESLKGVDLEEADGNSDLDNKTNRSDNGDLFPGSSSNSTFDSSSTPNSKNYLLNNTNLEIRNISESNNILSFSFGPAPGPPCAANATFTSPIGSFSDGSSDSLEYANNQNCSWLIQPASGVITLNFSYFRTEANNDSVTVYDGIDATAPLLGNYSGTTIPTAISSTGNSMYIEFNTNSTISDTGWVANYTSAPAPTTCGTDTLTATTGTFEDGSDTSFYENNIRCSWLIQPPAATRIVIDFNRFSTELNNDSVAIYDGTSASGTLVASFSGNNIPARTSINSGDVFIEFITNSTDTAAGWEITYASSPTCNGTITLTDSAGTVEDGSGPLDYDNSLSCSWLIDPTDVPVSITFTMNSANFPALGFGDRVIVRDGSTATSPIIRVFSSFNPTGTVTAFSSKMFLQFLTDATGTDAGWSGTYTSSTNFCDGQTLLTSPSGFFTDGSPFNSNYSNNSDCSWLIQPSAANRIVNLNIFGGIFNFDTEANIDTVTVYDGATTSSPILTTLSGNPGASSVSSTGGSMLITFKTNDTITRRGWRASYTTTLNPTCTGTTNLTAVSGTFDDGSVDSLVYSEGANCGWLINPTGANLISLQFNRFDLESPNDKVNVYDGSNASAPLLGSFSGTVIPPSIISSGGSLFVQFTTSALINKTGWEATYNSTTNQCFDLVLTSARDTIEDGSKGLNYDDNLNCTWLIEPTNANTVSLDFVEFDLSSDDTLFIYDGNSKLSPLLGSYTGTTLPSTLNSTGSSLFIEFITDASSNAGGWKAFYDITSNLSCVGTTTLVDPSGAFEDGSGSSNYDVNLNCGWLIQPPNANIIEFKMDSIQLGAGDEVRVYAGNSASGVLLRSYTSSFGGILTSKTGSIFVEFISDDNFTAKGWGASYISSTTFCTPRKTLTDLTANFEDGSPTAADYADNSDCEWLIEPSDPNVIINLRFFRFSTQLIGDTVTVYDGSTTNDPVLGKFSGTRLPNVTSTGNTMLVAFQTDSSNTSTGWRANYRTIPTAPCNALTTFTSASETFTDGSLNGDNYAPNTSCTWLIQPTNATSIDLDFNRFDTQSSVDVVEVFDGTSNAAPSLGAFSGTPTISTISSTGGSLFIEFTSNGILELNGWEASYTANIDSVRVNPDTILLGSLIGSTETFDILADGSWTSSDNSAWLDVTPASGSGNQTGTAEALQSNPLNIERLGEVYINSGISNSSDTLIVIQESNGSTLEGSPDTIFFTANPPGPELLTISSNVSWNLNTTSTWFNISTSSGTNNGSSDITATNNTTNARRDGFIVLNGSPGVVNDTIIVIQDTVVPLSPFITVNPSSITLLAANNSSSSFTVNSNVIWQTSTPATWLTVTNPASTVDTNTVQIAANTANPNTTSRNTYVAIQDVNGTLFDTVFVSQLGSNVIFSVSPSSITLNSPQGSNFLANLSSNVSWTASSGANWLSVNPLSGSTNATLTISANSSNTLTSARNSFIALEAANGALVDTLFVSQLGVARTLSVTPSNVTIAQPMNSTGNFTINSNIDWQTLSGATWLTITNPSSTSDTGIVQLTSNSMNPDPNPRNSFVAIQDLSGTLFDTVRISQLGSNPVLEANPDTIILAESSNSTINYSLASNGNWILSGAANWFSPTPISGSGSNTISVVSNSANPNFVIRSSFIAIEDTTNALFDTVTVIQEAKIQQLSTSPDTIFLASVVGSQSTFQIDAPVTTSWNSLANDNWISLSQSSGAGNTTILVSANSANTSKTDRITFIVTSDNGFVPKRDTVYVVQEGVSSKLVVTPSNLNLNFTSGSNDVINVNSNESWTASNPVTWLSLNPSSGTNNGTLTATTSSDNLSGSNRTATITFSASGVTDQLVTVTQIDGSQPNFDVSRDTVYVDNPQGSTANFSVLSNVSNWTLTENTPWLLVNPTSGSNTATITVLVATRNVFGNDRSAEITISSNGFTDKIVTVIQRATSPLFQASPSKLVIGPNIGDFSDFNISSNLVAWTATPSESWMSVNPSTGSFTEQLRVSATEKNTTSNIRNGIITIEAPPLVPQSIIVTQDTVRTIGLKENSFGQQINLYPNPTSGNVTLEFEESVNTNEVGFLLYSILGNKIANLKVMHVGNKAEVKLEGLAKGIYFLQMNYKGEVISRKISVIE